MIDQLFEFVQNHPLLVAAFALVLVAWIAYEIRSGGGQRRDHQRGHSAGQSRGRRGARHPRQERLQGGPYRRAPATSRQSGLDGRLGELEKYKSKPIIVACKHGQTAGVAMAKLTKAGFERVYKLKGGMTQWQTDGLPLVKK